MAFHPSSIINSATTGVKRFYTWSLKPLPSNNINVLPLKNPFSKGLSSFSPFTRQHKGNTTPMTETFKQSALDLVSLTGSFSTLATLLEANMFSFALLLVFQCYQTWLLMPEEKKKTFVASTQEAVGSYAGWFTVPTWMKVDLTTWTPNMQWDNLGRLSIPSMSKWWTPTSTRRERPRSWWSLFS